MSRGLYEHIDQVASVYVHIPFCQYRCSYCDFATYADQDQQMPAYVDALVEELRRRTFGRPKRRAGTIFFGGGTPSRLPVASVDRLMSALRAAADVAPNAEVTLEANP